MERMAFPGGFEVAKDNPCADRPPTANDDETQGYCTTSMWVHVREAAYICVSARAGKAIWRLAVGQQGDPGLPGIPGVSVVAASIDGDDLILELSNGTEIEAGNVRGPVGPPGSGEGVPAGGTTGQVLAKVNGTDYNTEWMTLGSAAYAATSDFASASHTHDSDDIDDASAVGKAVLTAASQAAARSVIGAGTSSFSGAYGDLSGIPSTFAPSSHNHSASEITSGTLAIARIPTGTSNTTVCIGDDGRLSDARTPTSHQHPATDINDSTATGRAVVTAASQSAARTAIGLGTVSTLDSDTDGTLAANSDGKVATQKAVKTYVDALIAASDAMVFKGVVNCSTNPNYPAADAGHTYRVSVAGKIGGGSGPNVEAGDVLICTTDATSAGNHATVGANWGIIQTNIDGALTTADIGISIQAYSAKLAAIVSLTWAADKGLYLTSTSGIATFDLSSFVRGLMNSADGSAVRSAIGAGTGNGSVTAVSIASANGITGSSSGGATPALTIILGAITPSSVNGLTLTAAATGFTIAGGTTPKTLTVNNSIGFSGTDGSTLNVGAGGTLGSAAFTAASAYQASISATGLLKGAGGGSVSAATAGGDYARPQDHIGTDCRLSTQSGVSVSTSDRTSQGTIYLVGTKIVLKYGSGYVTCDVSNPSVSVSGSAGQIFDVWASTSDGTTVALSFSTVWTNSTTRADALDRTKFWHKSGDETKRYVGTICLSGSNVTEDSTARRYVWSVDNRRARPLNAYVSTGSWSYGTSTWRRPNGGSATPGANQVAFVIGLNEEIIDANLYAIVFGSTSGWSQVALVLDWSSGGPSTPYPFGAWYLVAGALFNGYPGIGSHTLDWVEYATVSTTFYGNQTSGPVRSGIVATLWG